MSEREEKNVIDKIMEEESYIGLQLGDEADDVTIGELEKEILLVNADLPERFTATVLEAKSGFNKYGNRVLKFTVQLGDGRRAVFSVPRSLWKYYVEFMREHGLEKISDFIGLKIVFEKKAAVARMHPRPVPVKVV